jgi:hypothetical protein
VRLAGNIKFNPFYSNGLSIENFAVWETFA